MFRRSLRLSLLLLLLPVGEVLAELVVVVNPRNPIAVMSRQEVVHLFFGRLGQFANGIEAQPVDMLDKAPERVMFYQQLVGKELSEVNAYWARITFSGRQGPPTKVASAEEVVRWVSTHAGGIGFVERSRVDGRLKVVFELK